MHPPPATYGIAARVRPLPQVTLVSFGIVAGWIGLSMASAIVMGDTLTGPVARFVTGVLGLRDFAGAVTFLLALPVLLSPLLLPALLPWQTGSPLVAGMQGAVKLSSGSDRHRKRR